MYCPRCKTQVIPVDESHQSPEAMKMEPKLSKRPIDELTDEQRKEIFNLYVSSNKNVKCEEVDVPNVRLPGVEEHMKQMMAQHSDNVLTRFYTEFEELSTIQIAVYLFKIRTADNSDECEAEKMARLFSKDLLSRIVHDMRRYLAYRGLRREFKGTWGTIVLDSEKPEWVWLSDEGPTKTMYHDDWSAFEFHKDNSGTGDDDDSFKSAGNWSEEHERILKAGEGQLDA